MRLVRGIWQVTKLSLHDISKGDGFRKIPRPNQNDQQVQRMAHNTLSTTYKTESTSSVQRLIFKNAMILTYDSDDKISSVYGYIPEVSDIPVLIIAKDGYDVFTDILEIDRPIV